MLTMFHVKDPRPQLLLQHVLSEGQRIAVMLHLSIQAAVADHKPPFPGHLLGHDKAGGDPVGVTGPPLTLVDELPEHFLCGLFPLAPEVQLPVPVHTGICLQSYLGHIVRSTNRWREHRLPTEEGIPILLLQHGAQCLDLEALIELRLRFAGHPDH